MQCVGYNFCMGMLGFVVLLVCAVMNFTSFRTDDLVNIRYYENFSLNKKKIISINIFKINLFRIKLAE